MKLVVVESPYAGDVAENEKYARECMRSCIINGEAPIASHLLYTQDGVLNDDVKLERVLGISMGYWWGVNADAVVFFVDKGVSNGMREAKEFYDRIGIKCETRTIY